MNKKIVITLILVVALVVSCVAVASAKTNNMKLADKQAKVHEIAELARELGLPEDDPIIVRAQGLWWQWQGEKTEPTLKKLGNYTITGYDPFCAHCCGKSDGITASGKLATIGKTVAMKGIAFGTEIYIDGLGYYVVEDRGVGSGKVDIACDGHAECYAITGKYDVYIVE